MKTLLGAVSFLTVVRVPGEGVSPGRAAIFFPLVGAAIGAAGAAIYLGALRVLPNSLAALAAVVFWAGISGVLHEDGLADAADAFRAGRSKEAMLGILKDSRIGTFGAVAIVLSVIARWQAVEFLSTPGVVEVFIAAQAVPRAAMVGLAWVSRPAGTGAVIALAQGVAAAFLLGVRPGVAIGLGSYLIVRIARWYFYRRIGGVNGDCLGATEQILEIFVLVLFTCRTCMW